LDPDVLKQRVSDTLETDAFVFDVETRGEDPLDVKRNDVFWITIGSAAGIFTVPLGHSVGEMKTEAWKQKEPWYDYANLTKAGNPRKKWRMVHYPAVFTDPPHQIRRDQALPILEPLLFSDALKVGWNLKFDVKSIAKYYGERILPGPFWDGEVAEHILNENLVTKRLVDVVQRAYKFQIEPVAAGGNIDEQPFSAVAKYNFRGATFNWIRFKHQEQAIFQRGFSEIMRLDMDLLEALAHAEHAGARINIALMDELREDLDHRMKEVKALIWREAEEEINLNSNDQVAWFVYEHRGHKIPGWTSGGKQGTPKPKTDEAALKPLAKKDQYIGRILEHAELSKMYGTYVEGIHKRLNDEHVHPNHRIAKAVTGRLSCSDPNLQNIPAPRNDLGRKIRGMFVPPEGSRLFVADYAQIEPRTLAHFCQDPELLRIFRAGEDVYTGMGAQVYGKPQSEVERAERDAMKVLVLSLMYGVGIGNIASQLGVTMKRAKRLRNDFFKSFPTAYRWMQQTIREARFHDSPHTTTLMGRKRRLPDLRSQDEADRARAERQAINHRIQGTAGEIMKTAFVRLHRALPANEGMYVILTVHDEVVGVTPSDRVDEAVSLVSEAMTGPGIQEMLDVPIEAEVKIVDDWSQAK